ncbi:DUF6912 family protein [Changpingibacter yushuensis]|uniref:DUF6912 family protein n=1 Tax=Changpingibacter yushuensis TaxID=2758440 RepID=UPI00165DC630|nr:hypothetical protein [Changpingibacter yushuensis]
MRIYIPAANSDLSAPSLTPRIVHGVTRELEREFGDDEPEVFEAVAMNAAADDSVRLLAAKISKGIACASRRCVVVSVVPDADLAVPSTDELPTARLLKQAVAWDRVESIHVDDEELESEVRRAAMGDDEAFEIVADEDLMWYDVAERTALSVALAARDI